MCVIIKVMANTLFIGKDLPDGLEIAESFSNSGRKIFGVCKSEMDAANFEAEKIVASTWNRASAVSTLSLLIKAETELGNIDEVVFYFDANYFASKFELDKTEEIANSVDYMITGYFYAVGELLKRIDQKKEKITVSFLLRDYPSKYDVCSAKSAAIVPASNIVSAAKQAFISMAENFSTNVSDKDYISVLLAKCSFGNDIYKNEKLIGDWLCESLTTISAAKNHQSVKNAGTWNKVGSKVSTGFALFK